MEFGEDPHRVVPILAPRYWLQCGPLELAYSRPKETKMSFDLIVWIAVVWVLGALVAVILLRMAGDQDRAARHMEKEISPFSDVTITQNGER